MNELLARIEAVVMEAVRHQHARKRRRGSLAAGIGVSVALLLGGGIAVATISGTPIDRLLQSSDRVAQKPGTERIDLRVVDHGGLGWTSTTYITQSGTISTATAADGADEPRPSVGGARGFVLADNLLNGPLASVAVSLSRLKGKVHGAIAGVVDADVVSMVVEVEGKRYAAQLSGETLSIVVDLPAEHSLTAVGKRRAERMPLSVEVRPYLLALDVDALGRREVVPANVTTTLRNGTRRVQHIDRVCVHERCGAHVAERPR